MPYTSPSPARSVQQAPVNPDPIVRTPEGGDQFDFTASERFVWKATAMTTGGAFDTYIGTMQPDSLSAPEHIHDANDELLFVLEGEFRFRIGGRIHNAPTGTFAFVPRGIPHARVNVHGGVSRLMTQFVPGGMRGFFEATADLMQMVPPDAAALEAVAGQFHTRIVGPPLQP